MIHIQEHNGEYGVYTTKEYSAGSPVRVFESYTLVDNPTRTSIQIGPGNHIEDRIGKYVNHSCSPTCEIDGIRIVAIKDVAKGDEITFDYNKNEDLMASPFKCACCGKMITGAKNVEANFDGAGVYLREEQ